MSLSGIVEFVEGNYRSIVQHMIRGAEPILRRYMDFALD